MGTKVQNLPGYYSMRDLNEESSSCGRPLFYGDKTLTSGEYYNNYLPSLTADVCSPHDKEIVKWEMLRQEGIFKNQVCELHRLYRIQRHLMDEVKRKELHRSQMTVGTSFSTGALASQITSEDGQKHQIHGFPMPNSVCARASNSGIEGIHSPLGSTKGNCKLDSIFPSPNGSSSKDVEVLESRPSKVRRKMFDLQLPADEYIETEEEKRHDEKTSGTTIYVPDSNCKLGKESDIKFFCGNGGKTGSQEDSSRYEQSLRSRNGLADLNEPAQVEETNGSVHFLSHDPCQGRTECSEPSAKQQSRLFGFSREDLLNSRQGTDSRARHNGYLDSNGSGKGWILSMLEAGQAKSNLKAIPQALKKEQPLLSSQSIQDVYNKAHEPPSDYLTNRSKANLWREKAVCDLEISERSHEISINKHLESVVSSHRPSMFAVPSSDVAKSWSHSASSWEVASSSSSQKPMLVQMAPSLNPCGALSKCSQSGQSNRIFGDSWCLNMNSKSNPGFRCDVPVQNGFYPGSSGSRELSVNASSISYDYLNHNNDCKRVPEQFINHGSAKHNKGPICDDMKPGKDINLNVLFSHSSSSKLVPQSGLGIIDGEQKHEEHLPVLPWLKPKLACKNAAQNVGRGLISGDLSFLQGAAVSKKDETGKGPGGNFIHRVTSVSCSNDIESRRTEVGDSSSNKKILGVPIFDMPRNSSKKESSLFTSHSLSIPNDVEAVENNRENHVFDINLPCDPAVIELDKEIGIEASASKRGSGALEVNARNQIDLNLSMSEDEASLIPIPGTNVKMKAEIDLEVPAVPEMEDVIPEEKQLETQLVSPQLPQDKAEQPRDELMMNAAEAIVAISSLYCNQVDDLVCSPSESPMVDPLSWFADAVSTCLDDLESKSDTARGKDGECNEESSSGAMDYFERMTLQVAETKEEDYMPKPLFPENFNVEETGTTVLPARTRKGPARRGRQRRDFQRDILPGLASLLRHEVTEDLQTFGGLMRATGHAWSGLTRRNGSRNGCGRGRRRVQVTQSPPPVVTNETCTPLIQQLSNIEVGSEDRSLRGWGKTTRRPRRQRLPAGNPPSIPLT